MAEQEPLRVHIRVVGNSGAPIGEIPPGGRLGTNLEAALQMVEEVKKVHPNAKISVEVEV